MSADDLVALGRTNLQVSRLGLGLAPLGGMFHDVSPEQADATIDRAWELGVRFFDTAPVYGYGSSERRSGSNLRRRPREDLVLCTKVGRLIEPGGPDTQDIWSNPPSGFGPRLDYRPPAIRRSLEDSLERLGLDRVDVLHIHDPDLAYDVALREALPTLIEMREAGLIGAVSIGINHADVAARFVAEAPEAGLDCVLIAGRYTLLDQSADKDLLPVCDERGVVVVSAGLLHGGLLGDPAPGPERTVPGLSTAVTERAARIRLACRDHGVPTLAAAVQFPLGHSCVPSVLVGARTPAEVSAAAGAMDVPIPDEFWDDLRQRGLLD